MRILVVEDEEKVSRFVARGLTAERFAVDVARDGKSGWELAQTYQYDLIVLDLMLPGLTGSEVLRRTEPFAFAELLVRVKALLRRGPVTRASVLRIADLELDRLSQQFSAIRSGECKAITSRSCGESALTL